MFYFFKGQEHASSYKLYVPFGPLPKTKHIHNTYSATLACVMYKTYHMNHENEWTSDVHNWPVDGLSKQLVA